MNDPFLDKSLKPKLVKPARATVEEEPEAERQTAPRSTRW